jgi:hypothetical protein
MTGTRAKPAACTSTAWRSAAIAASAVPTLAVLNVLMQAKCKLLQVDSPVVALMQPTGRCC